MEFSTQMNLLIQLSLVDGDFSEKEEDMIYGIGRNNGMKDEDIKEILHHNLRHSRHELPDLSNLTEDDKVSYLYNVIRLMKADKEVYLTEIKFCERLADKLGFKKKVVRELSAHVLSDGSINTDVTHLRELVDKYRI